MTEIDDLATVRAQLRALTMKETALKTRVEALGLGVHDGDTHIAYVVPKTWCGLDVVRIKTECSEETWKPFEVTKDYIEITIARVRAKT